MNGTTNVQVRSVQLAVMAAPSATLAEAVAEARRRHDTRAPGSPSRSPDPRSARRPLRADPFGSVGVGADRAPRKPGGKAHGKVHGYAAALMTRTKSFGVAPASPSS